MHPNQAILYCASSSGKKALWYSSQDENLPRQEFEYDESTEASPEVDNLVRRRVILFYQVGPD